MNQALPLFCCGLLLLGGTQHAGSALSVKALSGIMKDKLFSAIYTCYKCCQKSSCGLFPITLHCTNQRGGGKMLVIINKLQGFPLFHFAVSWHMTQFIVANLAVNYFELFFFSNLQEMCLQSTFSRKNRYQEPVLTTYI